MLGMYIWFMTYLVGCLFLWTGVIFSKMNLTSSELISGNPTESLSPSDVFLFSSSSDKEIGIPTEFPGLTVLLSWLCPRYKYYFPLEGILLLSARLMRPVAYIYSLRRPGEKLN